MGLYGYFNIKNESEKKDFFFNMKDDKPETIEENGIKWKRDWSSIRVTGSIDTKWDCDSNNDWLDKTYRKKGNYGNLLDKSKELSEAREKKYGIDDRKKTYMENWSKKRRGKKCPDSIFGKSSKNDVIEIG